MLWRSGRTYSEDLRARAGDSGRWQRDAILQDQYFRCLQRTCATRSDGRRSGIAEKRTSRPQVRPRPRFQDRPYTLLADLAEWSETGPGMDCASQSSGQLRPRVASRSKEHLLLCPAGVRQRCVYCAAVSPRLGQPIPRAFIPSIFRQLWPGGAARPHPQSR